MALKSPIFKGLPHNVRFRDNYAILTSGRMAKGSLSQSRSFDEFRRFTAYAAIVGLVVLLGVWWYLAQRNTPVPVNQPIDIPVAVTPTQYTDFIGTVRTVTNGQLTVDTTVTLPTGEQRKKTFQVLVSSATNHQVLILNGGERRIESRSDGVAPGDMVQAFAVENLADIDSFTATRLIKIIRS